MAWRRKARRGRPRKPDALSKRRATTSKGRAPEVDLGSSMLRARKRAVTGREDLELTGAAVLLGHDLLDQAQYDTLGTVTELLQRVARAWGGRDGSLNGLWTAIIGAMVPTGFAPVPVGDGGRSLADQARRRLQKMCRQLDGSRSLVLSLAREDPVPPIVLRVLDHALTPEDAAALERLRQGLDAIGGDRRGRIGGG
jgi:hypothetical protein